MVEKLKMLELAPDNASLEDLKAYLEDTGFTADEYEQYHWFEYEEFKSSCGVFASLSVIDEKSDQWRLHVEVRPSASWYDVQKLNETIRKAHSLFGGKIVRDDGASEYLDLWEDETTPISRGIKAVYRYISFQISSLKDALPHPQKDLDNLERFCVQSEELKASLDNTRVIYNGLIPFSVALLEFFLKETFKILLEYDEYAIKKINNGNRKMKVDLSALLDMKNNKKSVEDIIADANSSIADDYSFQNLKEATKAYKNWLNIDLMKILGEEKSEDSQKPLNEVINEIIEIRHIIVHKFYINRDIKREDYLQILNCINEAVLVFIACLEDKYEFALEKETL